MSSKKGTKLTREQIGLMRAWIDQGVKWDPGVTFARAEPLNLKPRRPELSRRGDELWRPFIGRLSVPVQAPLGGPSAV